MKKELITTQSNNSLTQFSKQNPLIGNWINDDNELAIAKTFDDKRLKDYNAEDMVRLVEVMAKWRLLLGVTSDVSSAELTFICQFLYDNFKNITLSDINLSMNWAISGKIEIGFVSQKTISSFYVSKALLAYSEQKKKIVEDILYKKERHEIRESNSRVVELNAEKRANNFKDYLIAVYNNYEDMGVVNDLGDMVYKWLKKSEILITTPELVSNALVYGNEKYIEERQNESLIGIINKVVDTFTEENRKKKLARAYIISTIFSKMTLQELILKIKISHFEK
jgi:hypothetical protein